MDFFCHLCVCFCLYHSVLSIPSSLVVNCSEWAHLLALLYVMCVFCVCLCHFPIWCSHSGVVLDCIDS